MPVLPSYRYQSIDLLCKSVGWFLYEATLSFNGLTYFHWLLWGEYFSGWRIGWSPVQTLLSAWLGLVTKPWFEAPSDWVEISSIESSDYHRKWGCPLGQKQSKRNFNYWSCHFSKHWISIVKFAGSLPLTEKFSDSWIFYVLQWPKRISNRI